ncbi:hypothetical protein LX77_00664 [Gelidibacter algens]|uniref:Uncharacterized protein n=1 Tax=Gelidibacter algens TaxID=49280 RepID=A0A327SBJ4_9FLAO|nr:hypothetical protein LX77_00664 [Gelidibacter algens]
MGKANLHSLTPDAADTIFISKDSIMLKWLMSYFLNTTLTPLDL